MARHPAKKATTRRLGRKPVPENETRHDRFVRIGTKRMNAVIRQIQLLGNLASANYECESTDLEAMQSAITQALNTTFGRFSQQRKVRSATSFSFKQAAAIPDTKH